MRNTLKFFLPLLVFALFSGVASAQETSIVILVSDNSADLAVANTLAEKINVKVVVTPWGTLSDEAIQEIEASGAAEVYVVGGGVAVPNVEEKVNITVKRFAGRDRYHTSALVAKEWKNCSEVFVAVGDDDQGIQDVRIKAKIKNCPIVFVKPEEVPENVAEVLEELNVNKTIMVPAPHMNRVHIRARIMAKVGEIEEVQINMTERAEKAILEAEDTIAEAEVNLTDVINGRTAAAARLVVNAKIHLEWAQEAFDLGKHGEAFGLATAAKSQAENAMKISQNIVVGYFKMEVKGCEDEIKAKGLAKIKGDIDIEAGRHDVRIGMHRGIERGTEAGVETGEEGNITEVKPRTGMPGRGR